MVHTGKSLRKRGDMQVRDEAHGVPPNQEERDFLLSLIESAEAKWAADAWLMYKESGRGMFNISDQQLNELPKTDELVRWDWRPTYSTEESMKEAGFSDVSIMELKQFMDSYDPELEMIVRHIRLGGCVSIYVLRTNPRPSEAGHFANRTN